MKCEQNIHEVTMWCGTDVHVGMLGEAVKNPEMAQRYVNTHTHTHNTHECKNIFFSKIPLKYFILVVFEIQKIKNHFKYTVITLDFVFIHSWCHSSTMKCYCIISGKTPKIKYSKICNFWTVNSITVISFPLSLIFFSSIHQYEFGTEISNFNFWSNIPSTCTCT